jgi:hypothetical protein
MKDEREICIGKDKKVRVETESFFSIGYILDSKDRFSVGRRERHISTRFS